MARSVTPMRRPRDDDEEEEELSVDENGSIRSSYGSKRARLNPPPDESGSSSEEEDSSGRPVLPDSYRRSPNGKARAGNARATADEQPQKHQPGSIVRVKLTDFVTYSAAEFFPGPNLNMVIGPNGTGKSTLVCAICLGLGWSTIHLGRAKDISEFVKHGSKRGFIEIELAANPAKHSQNPVITTKITREGSKTDFYINGSKSSKKEVQKLARQFSIQVDNLCQFLPQDRVVEFAALSPVDLLTQTQRAAAPEYMSQWHGQLKDMRKQQKSKQDEQQSVMDHLKNMENRQRLDEADVTRMRERSDLQTRLERMEKFRPFATYHDVRIRFAEAKDRRREAERDYKRLELRVAPNLQAAEDKKHYVERIDKAAQQQKRLVERSTTAAGQIQQKFRETQSNIQALTTELEQTNRSVREARQAKLRHDQGIQTLRRQMENRPPVVDFAAVNERIRDLSRQDRDFDSKQSELRDEIGQLVGQGNQRKQLVAAKQAEKDHLQSQVGQQANKLRAASRDVAKAWEWIQAHRDAFAGEVYGPPMLECSVRDDRHAGAVETIIQTAEMLAFTVTTKQDFNMLQRELYDNLRLSDIYIRTAPANPLSDFRPPCSDDQLRSYGLDCWLLELLDGPEPVLAMLCDNRMIHQTAFSSRDVSEAQYQALGRSPISSWVAGGHSYVITRRREYGDKATSTRVLPLKQARLFTDTPVDRQVEQDIDREVRQAEGEMKELQESIRELQRKLKEIEQQRQGLADDKKALQVDKDEKQKALANFEALPTKIDALERKRTEAEGKITAYFQERRAITDRGNTMILAKGQLAIDYANAVEALRNISIQLVEVEIHAAEAKSDLQQLQARHQEEAEMLRASKQEFDELKKQQDELREAGKRLQAECQAITSEPDDEETREIYQSISNMTEAVLETEIQSVQARLEMTSGGNTKLLRDFEKRAQLIDEKRAQMAELENKLKQLEKEINDTRGRWEPELDELVGKISSAFAENFAQIQCAGEVGVHKDEDFDQWAIQIRVKFRENEPLSILDSHRQSGGERAVSTIFYLMALQSLARAPFRVVDEINQGMDPRNERLVHSRMVSIACASTRDGGGGGGSQYFLITPKLLNDLEYHPSMKVHCIASGEHMPTDHRRLDFSALAMKALAVRSVAGAH